MIARICHGVRLYLCLMNIVCMEEVISRDASRKDFSVPLSNCSPNASPRKDTHALVARIPSAFAALSNWFIAATMAGKQVLPRVSPFTSGAIEAPRRKVFLHTDTELTERICSSCRRTIQQQRRHASTATAEASQSSTSTTSSAPIQQASNPSVKPEYQLRSGLVLSRPPVITRDLHPFEQSYYLYQRRLNERLALPFTRYFYYKKGTPGDVEWKRKIKERLTPAREIGKYDAYGEEGWNDELLSGAKESDPANQREVLLQDAESAANSGMASLDAGAEGKATKKSEVERPMARITDADESGDLKSLNRLLQRTLYLLVCDSKGVWKFPDGGLEGKETVRTVSGDVSLIADVQC